MGPTPPPDDGTTTGVGALARARVLVPLYAALACVLTWPLAAHLGGSLTYGTEPVGTVPLFNLWTLRWNQDRLGHLYRHYWDAPIFHPTAGTFALSEPQPLTGLAFTPVSWATGDPVLAANLVLLAALTLNGWAAARLARRLGAAPAPAALVGVLAAGMPFVASQMGVLQLTMVFPLFLLLDAVVRWTGDDPGPGGRRRAAVEAAVWLAVTFLTCGYYGLFAVVGVGLPALVLVRRAWLTRDRLVDVALAAAVFAVLALPLVLTQADRTAGYRRPDELVRELSATTGDLWQLSPAAHGAGLLPWVGEADLGEPLYPGTVLMLLGVGGFALAYARLRDRDRDRDRAGGGGGDRPGAGDRSTAERVRIERRVVLFLVSGACLARLLSLGLNVDVGGTGPYALVRAAVPGFGSLRSPFRFAVLVEVFLVALSAYGLDALWRWRPGRRVAWGAVAAVAVVVAGVAEVAIAPVRLLPVDRREPDWAAWLDRHVADGATLAFLPAAADNGVASYEDTARAMLVTLDLHDDTVNGYSGLFPADAERLEEAVRDYPSDEADALLRRHDVADLVVDAGWLADDPVRRPWLEARYRRVFTGDDAVVYAVP